MNIVGLLHVMRLKFVESRTCRRICRLDDGLSLEAFDGPDIFRLLCGIHVSPEALHQRFVIRGIMGVRTILFAREDHHKGTGVRK